MGRRSATHTFIPPSSITARCSNNWPNWKRTALAKWKFICITASSTVIDRAVKIINARRAAAGEALLDISQLPMDDQATYDLMAEAYPDVELRGGVGEFGTLLSIEKARRQLGYEPAFSWRDAITS